MPPVLSPFPVSRFQGGVSLPQKAAFRKEKTRTAVISFGLSLPVAFKGFGEKNRGRQQQRASNILDPSLSTKSKINLSSWTLF
jgi:hypothetical protein